MGDRQPRIQREGAPEGVLRVGFAVGRPVDVLADHAVAAAQLRPRGGKA